MAAVTLINGNAADFRGDADLIMTDPPYDLPGAELARILGGIRSDHLVLVTSMRQLMEFAAASDWRLSFDFVLDAVVPKDSKARHMPHYTHQTGVYMTRNGAKSRFDRRRRERSDTFDGKGFWPTVLRSPRNRNREHGMAKNLTAWTDILGSFNVASVVDPFAGSGTTGFAALDLGIDATLVEIDKAHCDRIERSLGFAGLPVRRAA
ncbi:hypothetical protein Sa4125_29930 [Aureimonas sp. SA4125]|uniref:DNA methyltransferase n=1 Tax=Aureimonas sp. SA4125 TaxID=2826993 RepID=UPI001CC585D8|nr:DNA methyltransferase [Aureimonas sp. SA4125]BDA85451.1 hypothetical protein Sa4125_29930 [Aureimonas sp. SA4125]